MPGNNLGEAHGAIKINTSDLKNADIALRSAGMAMLGVGTAAVGAFAAVVGAAAKFEKEMDFVQAVTAATEDEMDALKAKAIEMGKESIFGPIQLSRAFVELAKAGASVDDIINGVGEAAVSLAAAADVEIPFAGENLLNILNAFQLEAEDATHVADLLAGAANASSVELSDIVTTMRYAGPAANAMGISLEEVNAALTVLGRVGIKGSTAGTSLRFMMTRLVPDTDKAKTALQSLGLTIDEATGSVVEFSNQDGSLKNFGDVIQVLKERTQGLNEQQQVAVINDIFGVRALPSALALMEAGAEGFQGAMDEIERTTAADVAAARIDNLDGSIKRLKATIESVMVDAGGPFQNMVKGWVDGLRELILFFDSLPGPVKSFIVGAVGVIGVLSLMSGVFLLTIGNMVRAVRVMGEITNAFRLFAGGARAAAGANSLLSLSLLASPWFWIALAIAAVIAAIVLLYMKSEEFRKFVDKLWQDLQKLWDSIVNGVVTAWHAVQDFFKNWEKHWETVKDAVGIAWDWIQQKIGEVVDWIVEKVSGIGSKIADAFGGVVNAVGNVVGGIVSWFQELPGRLAGFASAAVRGIIGFFAQLPARLGFIIGFAIGRMIRLWFEVPVRVAQALATVIPILIRHGLQIIQWAYTTFTSFLSTIWGFLTQIPGFFLNIFTSVLNFLISFIPQLFQAAWDIGWSILHGVIDFVMQLPGQVWGFIQGAWDALVSFIPSFTGSAMEIGGNILSGIIDIITDLPGLIGDILGNVIDVFTGMVSRAFNAAKSFAGGLWNGFKSGLGIDSPSYIEEAMFAIDEQADATKRNLVRTVRSMGRTMNALPINTGALGITSPMTAAAAQNGTWVQQGPLVGTAIIREKEDITRLTRQIFDKRAREARARGVKLQPVPGGV